ncbi:hypothetical protein MKW92_042736 [Papaver armeniacum]|nr:hypothetical protein MKW92_042736 [Papaver armeniacum]
MNSNIFLNSLFPVELANLTSLSVLELSRCNLNGSIPYIPQLEELDVSGNPDLNVDLNRMFKIQWPKLRKLWISHTQVNGSFLHLASSASSITSLSASSCSIQGSLPSSFSNLSQLQYLDLYKNSITGDVHSLISNLKYLHYLDLSLNNFQGTLPKSICEILPLRKLFLADNNLTGSIPSCITKLQHLRVFRVSNNSIEGNVLLPSFFNEMNLSVIDLSSNRLTIVIDQPLHLYPRSRLETLMLRSCNLKGIFPASIICNSNHLYSLDLSDNNLTGAIPSCLFKLKYLESLDLSRNNLTGAINFNLFKLESLEDLNLSNNKLHGPLPPLPKSTSTIDVSNNQFSGEISIETGKILSNCGVVNLSGNKLSGSLSSLCLTDGGGFYGDYAGTFSMDLSNNNLSGSIPTSIGRCSNIQSLNLANNNLTGTIPNELQLGPGLALLQLNGNNLKGTLNFITKLHNLVALNLADNNFEGTIPASLSSFQDLKILSLRSNKLSGSIPEGIIHLQKLQILDLSLNNLSGPIPREMGNLMSLLNRSKDTESLYQFTPDLLGLDMVIKGIMLRYKLYSYSSGIDLSCNSLDGSIPEQISLLKGLAALNLSHNRFSGNIPTSVGDTSGLGSLDLSSNRLFGHIPQSFTRMDSLGFLNLSYNNLSGRIPRGNHFDTLGLEGLVFVGNDLLCGYPIKKLCDGDQNSSMSDVNPRNEVDEVDQEDVKEKLLLYAIVSLGVAVGFWGLFFVMLLKKEKWWFPYWGFVHSVAVRITSYFLNNN